MNFNLIFIGFIFTAVPGIGIVDLAPDFIGWLLITYALSRLAFTNEHFGSARKLSIITAAVTLVKFLLMFTMGFVDNTMLLVYSFAFAAIEIYLGFMWSGEFFGGCEHTMSSCDAAAIKLIDRVKFAFLLAVIARCVLNVLPEFLTVIDPSVTGEYSPNSVIAAEAFPVVRNAARIAGLVGALIVGVFSAAKLNLFCRVAKKDKTYSNYLNNIYEKNYLSNVSFRTAHTIKSSLSLFSIGVFFLISIFIDSVNIIPGAIFFILAFVAFRRISRVFPIRKSLIAISAVGTIISVSAHIVQIVYAFRHTDSYAESFSGFPVAWLLGIAQMLAAAFIICGMAGIMNSVCRSFLPDYAPGKRAFAAVGVLGAVYLCFDAAVYSLPVTGSLFMVLTALGGLIYCVIFSSVTGKIKQFEIWNVK